MREVFSDASSFQGKNSISLRIISQAVLFCLARRYTPHMHILVPNDNVKRNIPALLREAGYHQEINRRTGEISYVRSAGSGQFPRFHVYVKEEDKGWQVNLHLDQKAPSYGGTAAHAGEYDGEVVEAEGERLRGIVM